MADSLSKQHIDAGLTLLRATGYPVYPDVNGYTPENPARPYMRVYTSIQQPTDGMANALSGTSATWVTRWYVHAVADNEYAAEDLAALGRTALVDARPTIAGRAVNMIDQEASEPTRRDTSGPDPVFDRVDVYTMQTAPG